MNTYQQKIELRWSDLDPNFHLRHSAYYDFGAYLRVRFFNENGLSNDAFLKERIGPILFREECIFRRELKMGDEILVDIQLVKAREDFSRWTIQHEFIKNSQRAALLTVDGAWINTDLRKLAVLPENLRGSFNIMPKAENFEWIVK